MLGAIFKVNGRRVILFHVEQQPPGKWFYHWRIPTATNPAVAVWRECACVGPVAEIHPPITGLPIEIEWRLEDDAPWGQVALLRFTAGTARFRITAKQDLHPGGDGCTAVARSPYGSGLAAYHLPDFTLRAGESVELDGTADAPILENVLLVAGEFHTIDQFADVTNLTASTGSWEPDDGPMVPAPNRGVSPRGYYAHAGAPVPAGVIASDQPVTVLP